MGTIEEKSVAFYTMLCNTYLDEEKRAEVETLKFPHGGDLAEDLTAILVAAHMLYKKACPGAADADLFDFIHVLNRLAIQYCFDDQID